MYAKCEKIYCVVQELKTFSLTSNGQTDSQQTKVSCNKETQQTLQFIVSIQSNASFSPKDVNLIRQQRVHRLP